MTDRIVDIAQRYLKKVRQSGPSNLIALCPFHQDESPSFAINKTNGLWICYACGAQGNLRSFLLRIGLSHQDIEMGYGLFLKDLSKQAPPKKDPLRPNVFIQPEESLPEDLLGLFHYAPYDLLNSGFEEETLKFFEVGFDKWHMRITFPLRDIKGNLVGISGRTVIDDEARYKVYDLEYEIWELPRRHTEKRALLWNAHNVYPSLFFSNPKPVVVVEGFKACMWVWQAGFKNVVALMTNRLSWEQKLILQQLGGPVLLMLDNNEGGEIGTQKVGDMLCRSLPTKVVLYDAEQPDGLEPNQVIESINKAEDFFKVMAS